MSKLPALTDVQTVAAVETAGESIALTSGAGCGKTLVLARRFTTLLLGSDAPDPLQALVSLTFTEKAAAEMLSRVRAVLKEALAEADDPLRRERLTEWLTELPAARISTIHSFCASLLRRHAVEAEVDPAFSVCADELVAAQMLNDAVEQAVLAAVEDDHEGVSDLLARTDLGRVVDDVRTLVQRRVEWRPGDYTDPDEILNGWRDRQARLRKAMMAELRADGDLQRELATLEAWPCLDAGGADKLDVYRREQLAVVRRILDGPETATGLALELLNPKPGNIGGVKAWGGAEERKEFRRRLTGLVARLAALRPWFVEFGPADVQAAGDLAVLTRLYGGANERYRRAKRAEGMLDFDDLIDLSAGLLDRHPHVRRRFRKQLGQLLIDECQDTDAKQLTMIRDLLCDDGIPPAGKLFVVGDLKQSIYRFRGARAEVFADLCRSFGDGRVNLNKSFRTHRAGTAFVNHLFAEMMDGYEPVESAREEVPPDPSVEILLADCGESPNAGEVVAAQAQLTAQRISEMIGSERRVWDRPSGSWREVRAGDVAILFARMTQSAEYERALQDRNVPYYVVAGTDFFRQQEVYDLLNALQVIDNPYDDVALAGTLRGAMFALDDNVLLHLAEAAKPPYFRHLTDPAVLDRLAEAPRGRLAFAAELLGRLHADKDALAPAGLIEALLAETAYEQVLLSQFNGRRKLGNVRRMLDAARGAASLSLADFVQRYSEFVLAQSRYEQAAVAGEDEDVVRLMTIHKAKGLEFPVVVVPDLNFGTQPPGRRLLLSHEWGVTFQPPKLTGEDDSPGPLAHELARECERRELAAEDIRKLYVAITRHKDHLVLIGADHRGKDGGFRSSTSYLAQLDEALGLADRVEDEPVSIPYGPDGAGFRATLVRITPWLMPWSSGAKPVGREVVEAAGSAGDVAEGLASAAAAHPPELPLLAPLPDKVYGGGGPVAVTALADFQHCPMLYRWRYELRVPDRPGPAAKADHPESVPVLDAATTGTVLHRCMELADLAGADLPSQAQSLVGRVFAEMELPDDPAPLAGELAGMLELFDRGELAASIRQGRQALRELSFVLDVGGLKVAGQIDLLYQDADGTWRVVDYKSDRVGPDDLARRGERYELQMMLYMAAAGRHLGAAVAEAMLYFLRPGVAHRLDAPSAEGGRDDRLGEVVAELAHSRRTGVYRRDEGGCGGVCPYRDLCGRQR